MKGFPQGQDSGMRPVEPEAAVVSRSAQALGPGLPSYDRKAPRSKILLRLARERVGRIAAGAGWIGGVGAALLLIALAASWFVARDTDERRAALAAERAALLRGEGRQTPVVDERERLKTFYDRFPPAADLPARLHRLDELAVSHGVTSKRTDYRSGTASGTSLQVVSLAIPIEGEFKAIYDWLADVLNDMPEVALESLNVKRADSATSAVEAEARLQIYLRSAR
ncbi:MAG TPA: hypothetical protein VJ673_14460 [Aromatoleum sp.]|uniref:hypothetical protein n=1 Tax=Aromatoleum sp. TaxID=2307007 RepID=UPI002B46F5D8|nr:hypothetical protein [Aromatoleum sp.]HJV26887.1 hypothetical protein [Aromatoleum sp.]